MNSCVFCKIVGGEIPKKFDYVDDEIVAFPDINPLRPIHILIIPKAHIEDFFHADKETIFAISSAIKKLIDKKKLMGKGYKVTVNGGGAQEVGHLHFHLIAPVGRATTE